MGVQEQTENLDQLFEYTALTDQWMALAPMLIPRGHASSSTISYGCGFLIAGGSINGQNVKVKTDDVSYYDITSNEWTSIGTMQSPLKTPVCGIYGNYLYCSTGYTVRGHRRKLQLGTTTA